MGILFDAVTDMAVFFRRAGVFFKYEPQLYYSLESHSVTCSSWLLSCYSYLRYVDYCVDDISRVGSIGSLASDRSDTGLPGNSFSFQFAQLESLDIHRRSVLCAVRVALAGFQLSQVHGDQYFLVSADWADAHIFATGHFFLSIY